MFENDLTIHIKKFGNKNAKNFFKPFQGNFKGDTAKKRITTLGKAGRTSVASSGHAFGNTAKKTLTLSG